MIGIQPETLSRWENGKQLPSKTIDHAVRYWYALYADDPELGAAARACLEAAIKEAERSRKPPAIAATIRGNRWSTTAA